MAPLFLCRRNVPRLHGRPAGSLQPAWLPFVAQLSAGGALVPLDWLSERRLPDAP